VEVLEDHGQGLDLALARKQALHRIEYALATLRRIEPGPRLVGCNVEQRQERGQRRLQCAVERKHFARDALAHLPCVVARLNLEIAAKEIDDGQVDGGLAVGDRSGLNDQPAAHPSCARRSSSE
jgi:hypothetical protein